MHKQQNYDHLEGLSGWIIPMTISIMLVTLASFHNFSDLPVAIDSSIWAELTNAVNDKRINPNIIYMLISLLIIAGLLPFAQLYVLILIITKNIKMPRYYIVIAIITLASLIAEYWMKHKLLYGDKTPVTLNLEFLQSSSILYWLILQMIFIYIWIPYLLFSKRVKVTFVNRFKYK